MKKRGRRFPWLWIYLFTAGGSGCSGCCCEPLGCNDCHEDHGCSFNDNSSCNVNLCGDAGDCFGTEPERDSGCLVGCGPPVPVGSAIVKGLVDPTAVATDGVEVFFVDQGMLFRVEPDGSSPVVLASGVGVVGNLEADGLYVYWSGTWSGEASDGGVDAGDAGEDAGDDASTDAGEDAGTAGNQGIPGVFRVPTLGGDVERVAALDPLPTLVEDGTSLFLRARTDDAGGSTLGSIGEDDGGFVPIVGLVGNTENLHAFARDPNGLVALDVDGVVAITADAGKTLLATGAGASSILGSTSGALDVSTSDGGFRVVALSTGLTTTGAGSIFALAAHGDRLFVAQSGTLSVYAASALVAGPSSIGTDGSTPRFLAADDTSVYWISAPPTPALFRAALP